MSYTFKLLSIKIKSLLDEYGLMIKDVAEKNGIKPPALSQFLKNGSGLSMDNVELLCNYFGIKSIDIPEVKQPEIFPKKETKKMQEVMYLHLVNTLGENDWNIKKTAEALGMGRWKLYKILEEHKITKPK
jgi:transcriptional regulator with XRE-family HTH domain